MRPDVPGIKPSALDEWFTQHIAEAQAPLNFAVITGGHSNITYAVTDAAGQRFVLRRPPLGHVLATAHDMGREHRIISALGPTAVPVPPALGHCDDASVNDAPFYVMTFVDGVVINTVAETDAAMPDHEARRRTGEQIADNLAKLHRVDVDAVGLGDLARREGFLDRQLKRWRSQWESSKTRELPDMEAAFELLLEHKPPQRYTGIVHGDYRIGNMLVRPEGGVNAVLDWELCTLGDVLADVGYLLNFWAEPGDDMASFVEPPPTAAGGFPDRDAFLKRYAAAGGFDVSDVEYYRAFSYWRSAAIVEGVKRRYLEGVMVDDTVDTDVYERRVTELAAQSLALISSLRSRA
jgi:aminoglycoside phosphotransferase (APT) family kinase protein